MIVLIINIYIVHDSLTIISARQINAAGCVGTLLNERIIPLTFYPSPKRHFFCFFGGEWSLRESGEMESYCGTFPYMAIVEREGRSAAAYGRIISKSEENSLLALVTHCLRGQIEQ